VPKALKIILVILGFILFIFIGLVLLNVIPLSPPEITEVIISKDVNRETAEPLHITNEFEVNVPAIFCVIKVKSVKGQSLIKAEWIYEGRKLTESNLTVPGEKFLHYQRQVYFELKKPSETNWNPGDYEVKIYLDNQYQKKATFKVKQEKGQSKEAIIEKVVICSKVDENYAPLDEKDSFPPDTYKIHCSVKVTNAQKGAVIKAQWWNKNKEQLLDSASYTVQKDNSAGYVVFSHDTEGQKWEKGDYEVKIYVGDKLIKIASFKIQ